MKPPPASAPPVGAPLPPRLQTMLAGPVLPTVWRMGWPNTLMMLALPLNSLVEMWFLAKLGTDVLAGVAVVLPLLMLMQNMALGAMGGAISSAIARALGQRQTAQAHQLVAQALALNVMIGLGFTALLLLGGPWLYRLLGAERAALEAALAYSNVAFGGALLPWLFSAFASAIRGTGNMIVPGSVMAGGAVLMAGLSPCLIFGLGPFPALGVAGGAWSLLCYYGAGTLLLGWYCLSGRNPARLIMTRLRWQLMRGILSVGALASFNSVMTNGLIALTTALVGWYAGTAALAGYGAAIRLEYLLLPMAFGMGGPLVALVSANIGAGQPDRARRLALAGGAIAFLGTALIGLAGALWPRAWLELFSQDEAMIQAGTAYLQIAGPCFGFFGLGFTLYFASQGAGQLKWPLLAVLCRLLICVGLGWLVLSWGGSLRAFFTVAAAAMVIYGLIIVRSVAAGRWFPR